MNASVIKIPNRSKTPKTLIEMIPAKLIGSEEGATSLVVKLTAVAIIVKGASLLSIQLPKQFIKGIK